MDNQEFVERSLMLLLAQGKGGLTPTRLQKEMFLFSEIRPDLKEDLNFEQHYLGPYSRVLEETVRSPTYLSNMFAFQGKKIFLSSKGKKEYQEMLTKRKKDIKFNLLISSLKILRTIYDKLSETELLFLVYVTYPEFTKNSSISYKLLNNPLRKRILSSLKSKEVITDGRYEELLGR